MSKVSGYGGYEPALNEVRNPKAGFCPAEVSVRDTYRYTGRSASGFEMHWNHRQCKCRPMKGRRFCRAHLYLETGS